MLDDYQTKQVSTMSQHYPRRRGPDGPPHDADSPDSPLTTAVDQSTELPLSIVVPVFGSESTLSELCQGIATAVSPLASQFEIILVDDASADSSWRAIEEICARDDRVVGVHLSTNLGQQRATLRGLSLARGRTVVTLDDDLQQYPEDIPLLCQALERSEVLLHDAVEHGDLRLAPLVLERVGHTARSAEVVGRGWEPMPGACLC